MRILGLFLVGTVVTLCVIIMLRVTGKGKVVKQFLIRCYCFIRSHDTVNLYTLNNSPSPGEPPRSTWGKHACLRCGKEIDWQWDHY